MVSKIKKVAQQARQNLESGRVDRKLLAKLYAKYNQNIEDPDEFVAQGLAMFPRLCCGIASVYLKHLLGSGKIVTGKCGEELHTFLLVDDFVIDITGDQFGGQSVFIGQVQFHISYQSTFRSFQNSKGLSLSLSKSAEIQVGYSTT